MERFEQLNTLLQSGNLTALRQALAGMNEVDIADFMQDLDKEKTLLVFRLLPKDLFADVFSYMEPDRQQLIVESISDKEVQRVIDDLYMDDVVDFLEEVPANVVKRVLRTVDKETRKTILEYLQYPRDSAASLMTPEFVEFHERTKIVDALQMIRETAMEKETLDVIYVIDQTHHLTGFTTLYKLITADEQAQVADCMDKNVLSVHTLDDKEQVARTFTRYDLSAMPVVDHEGRLVGLITVDDIVDVIQDENTEDMEIMAAMTPSEKPYLKTSVFDLAKHRVLWLLILMVSATVTGRIISYYDGLLQTAVVLASFIPMLMDTGGNCGSQASVMVIRGLALGEVEMRDILRVLWKELRVGLLVGVVLSVVNFGRIMLFEGVGTMVALTVSLSLFVTVVVAKCIGCSLPIVARRCGFDPAVMASPFITTIIDAISLVVFFNVATNLLHLAA